MRLKARYEAACALLLLAIPEQVEHVIPIPELCDIVQAYAQREAEFYFENALYAISKDVGVCLGLARFLLSDNRAAVKAWNNKALLHFRARSKITWWSTERQMEDVLRWAMNKRHCSRIWCFYDDCHCDQPLVA